MVKGRVQQEGFGPEIAWRFADLACRITLRIGLNEMLVPEQHHSAVELDHAVEPAQGFGALHRVKYTADGDQPEGAPGRPDIRGARLDEFYLGLAADRGGGA
jgi:hypothetical protein